jgi:pepF/M3 family oligoendopeptidase
MKPGSERLPRWELSRIYPGFASREYAEAKLRLLSLSDRAGAHIDACPPPSPEGERYRGELLAEWLFGALELEESALALFENLSSYCYARYATATRDPEALSELGSVESLGLPLRRSAIAFRGILAARRPEVEYLMEGPDADPRVAAYACHIGEELLLHEKEMPAELEALAAELSLSGADAWGRLQESLSANASALWDEGSGERKTIVELRNLAYSGDRALREKAYRLELEAWESIALPMAAALNGVKGFALSLDRRRGWESELDKALARSRISRAGLDALIAGLEGSLPSWNSYLRAKARALGLERCAFYDLFAPVASPGSGGPRRYRFAEARDLIVESFGAFDPAMGDFAARAFAEGWIDAEPHEGKVDGALCLDFPDAKTARVLCNFGGSFSDLSTMAHELGHAWQRECVKDKPYVLARHPPILAEAASIFAETVVFEGAMRSAPPEERLGLLESHLSEACQLVVDILSRFYFERSLFERRERGELPPEELCRLMLAAQRRAYGEGLEPDRLHPYLWAAKGHYYSAELPFYNFPYAFGQLFGAGLYARYRSEGASPAEVYRVLLSGAGSSPAAGLAPPAVSNPEGEELWKTGLGVYAAQIVDFARKAADALPPPRPDQ